MGELYGTCALLAAVLFFVLLQKFESRFGKVDKELGEIKKRMDDLLKAQEKMASGPVRAKEDVTAETLDNTDILPYVTEELPDSTVTALKEEKAVEEKAVEGIQPIMAETTPQKLNASLEKESAEATLQETSPEAPLEIPSVSKRKQVNYEKFIGENLFGKIGILVFVIGVGFFVKYAIDKDWINETLRTVLGFLTGSALLVVAERLQKKYRTFSSLLAGGAFAVFYLTVAIAFHFYHLFPQTVAFIILIATTLFMSILSILYDRRELAIISLVGGFLAPFLVSTGNGNYLVLFTYMSILNLGMFGLSIYMGRTSGDRIYFYLCGNGNLPADRLYYRIDTYFRPSVHLCYAVLFHLPPADIIDTPDRSREKEQGIVAGHHNQQLHLSVIRNPVPA